jgi:macrolide-specific efflux system membrane fusion protein
VRRLNLVGLLRIRSLVAAAILVLLLSLVSCFLAPREEEILAPPLAVPPEIDYQTAVVTRQTIEDSIRTYGVFTYAYRTDLFFEERGGRLKAVHVRPGDEVSQGDLVAELYTDEIEAEIAQAELSLRRARLALREKQEQLADSSNLEIANEELQLAQLRLDEARYDLQTEEEIAQISGTESAGVRDLRVTVAERELAVTRAQLEVDRLRSESTPIQLELAEIDVESASLRLDELNRQLNSTMLPTPLSGIVTWVNSRTQAGDTVAAFQGLLRVSDPSDLVFEYQGSDAGSFRPGMECTVEVNDVEYPGSVVLTPSSVPFDQRQEYEETVQIRVEGLPPDVSPGRAGMVTLVLARREDVLVVPKRAVQRYASRRYVNVLVNGVRVERDVEVGLESQTESEIVAGLAEGDKIVLR